MSVLVNTGLYSFQAESVTTAVEDNVRLIYGDAKTDSEFFDFSIEVKAPSLIRRLIRPQVSFYCDGLTPFHPLPFNQSYALLEWGMNWCVAAHEYNDLIVHSAVIVKNNQAIILPALPGSGKSTLSAFFSQRGWKVYSDEMAVIDLTSLKVKPLFRPVCLKNNSIDIIKSEFPSCTMTETVNDTQKGDVAHLKVTTWSQYCEMVPVPIKAIVFPRYQADTTFQRSAVEKTEGFLSVIQNAFNYHVLGESAFQALVALSDTASYYRYVYNNLDAVLDAFNELVNE
ncbi:HprK-related kinase A [Alteromonas sp. H39]|uniref:HprK-related kinase A n=1 Tax=Alteromonas sp. H39 TaxID=3389876 RepID=UPI0039E07923